MQGKVALVTGAARRVGAEIVRTLHAAGANVVIHYHRSGQEAEVLAAQLEGVRSGSTLLVQGDILDTAGLQRLVTETVARFGRLDLLVNNASSFYASTLEQVNLDCWDDLVGTNLKAPLFLSQAAAAELRKTQGSIVNIVDIHAERPLKNYIVYSIAKAGLAALTRSLSIELGPEVRVNGVAPGVALWPEAQPNYFDAQEQQAIVAKTPLKRVGTPQDIATTVRFLAFEAQYVTGQILAVDGGRSTCL